MQLHPDRYSTTGVSLRKTVIVVHDAESGDSATASLLRALQSPGDRLVAGSNPPRKYGSGYSAVTDGNGGYVEVADPRMGPYAAPPLNKTAYHVCMPGRAAQTRDEWLDPVSRNHIRGVAKFIVDKSAIDGIPLHRLDFHGLLAGDRGYCSHNDVSQAWHQTDHTDPGKNFPWDVLASDIAALVHAPPAPPVPPQEDDMRIAIFKVRGFLAVFLAETTASGVALNVRWSGPGSPKVDAAIAAHLAAGAKEIEIDVGDLANTFLLGPLPHGDVREWTADDFAGV